MQPSPQSLAAILTQAGITLTPAQTDALWKYHTHLRARNEALNMTRIYEFEAMAVKLYLDSAVVGKLVTLPSPLLDIGTGPGFPGIPLAILHPGVQFLLSEGRHKRNEFLSEVVKLTGLKNVEVLGHRIAPEYERPVMGVITRAVETIDQTLDRVLRCLQPGGKAIFMKGPDCDDEIAAATRKLGRFYRLADDIPYQLLDTDNRRRLVIYERNDAPAPRPVTGEVLKSADNARFRTWKSLLASRGVKKEGLALVTGKAAIEVLAGEPDAVTAVLAREGAKTVPEQIGFETTVLAAELFEQLAPDSGPLPAVVVKAPAVEPAGQLPERCIVTALQDPGELGALVRTAAYFGWADIVLAKEAANPFHPEALAAAGLAAFRARFSAGPETGELPSNLPGGFRLAGAAVPPTKGPVRIFVGHQPKPEWRPLGETRGEFAPAPAVLLAAALGAVTTP